MFDVREIRITVNDADTTAEVARRIAYHVETGDILILGGDLGAGKTTFTKAFGAALGVEDVINSPTFALAQIYEGAEHKLHHLDVYRLADVDETLDLALPELADSGDIVVIEWGDTITKVLQQNYLEVSFEFNDMDGYESVRTLVFRAVGQMWAGRMAALTDALTGIEGSKLC